MKETITINIEGKVNTGTSSILNIIERTFKKYGFCVDVHSLSEIERTKDEHLKVLKNMKDNTRIVLNDIQLKRNDDCDAKLAHCILDNNYSKCEYRTNIRTNCTGCWSSLCALPEYKCSYMVYKSTKEYKI